MRAAVKQFIEETIDWIENDKWSDVAYKAETWEIDDKFNSSDMIELWGIIRDDLGIDILKFEDVEAVPRFYYCLTDIKSIDLPDHILHINAEAFHKCAKLDHVTIPKSVISISSHAFSDTPNLSSINYDGYLAEFKQINIGYSAFGYYAPGKNSKKLIAKDGVMNL